MMLLSILMGFTLIGVVFSDPGELLRECVATARKEAGAKITFPKDVSDLKTICPIVFDLMDCMQKVVETETGLSMQEMEQNSHDPDLKKAATIFNSVRGLVTDICADGTDLHIAYKNNIDCLVSMDENEDMCRRNAMNAYFTYIGYNKTYEDYFLANDYDEENREETDVREEENIFGDSAECLVVAYTSACLGTQVDSQCGHDAFKFYQTIVKRSSLIKVGLCSEEALEELKNDFLDSLQDIEEHHRHLYRLAFDLRKRKK